MIIAFLTLFDQLCMYTPTHTIPNNSHLEERLGGFSTKRNCHPLSHWNSKTVSGTNYLPSTVDRRILLDGVPPTFVLNSVSDISLLVYKNAFDIWMLTFYPTVSPNSFIKLSFFWRSLYSLICMQLCHLQTVTALFLPFTFWCLLFLFLVWSLRLGLPILCWMGVVKADILAYSWS